MTKTYATIADHVLHVTGEPSSGWQVAAEGEVSSSKGVSFTFSVQDDGNQNFLLVYSSIDGMYAADTWHETIEEAYACAHSEFGIQRSEWFTLHTR